MIENALHRSNVIYFIQNWQFHPIWKRIGVGGFFVQFLGCFCCKVFHYFWCNLVLLNRQKRISLVLGYSVGLDRGAGKLPNQPCLGFSYFELPARSHRHLGAAFSVGHLLGAPQSSSSLSRCCSDSLFGLISKN